MGIGRIVLVGRFIIECSPDGWTGTDLGLGLKIVVLPLNALMLKDNFAEGPSMSYNMSVYFILFLYHNFGNSI
jgi:hypothetical protein